MSTPAEELVGLPLVEADRLARERIEEHRQAMSEWKAARVQRVRAEVESGVSAAEVGRQLGLRNVYDLIGGKRGRGNLEAAHEMARWLLAHMELSATQTDQLQGALRLKQPKDAKMAAKRVALAIRNLPPGARFRDYVEDDQAWERWLALSAQVSATAAE